MTTRRTPVDEPATAAPVPPGPRASAFWLRAASVLVGCALSLLLLAGAVLAYVGFCRASATDATLVTPYPRLARLFADRQFEELLRVASSGPTDEFDTMWDTTAAVRLSREEFVPTDMYGQVRYRYRPFLRHINLEVWSGLDRQRFSVLDRPQIRAAADRCRIFRKAFIETDRDGFKKTDFTRAAGDPTVLFVGDSFTEGLDVSSPDTFVNIFGRRMQGAGLRGVPVNAGVNGYGTLEECWTVEHYANPLNARLVVANLFPNDVEADYISVVRGGPVPEAAYAEMFRYLDRMWSYCRQQGIHLVVAAIPAKEQLDLALPESPFEKRIGAWCASRHLLFLDPLDAFRRAGTAEIYFPWDPHFSEKGHAWYARFLFENTLPTLRSALGR